LEAHERWWTQIWQSQLARGVSVATMTPEFGRRLPALYAVHRRAVADLSQINAWMGARQKQRFATVPGASPQSQSGNHSAERPSTP